MIATLNLNGDYVSDALAAQVGGIGIAPGANMSDSVAMFEATHGTAPKYAGKDYVNPGSEILSAEMMLRHMGWTEAADLIISSMEKAILSKKVTYDFARLMDGRDAGLVLGLRPGDDRQHVIAARARNAKARHRRAFFRRVCASRRSGRRPPAAAGGRRDPRAAPISERCDVLRQLALRPLRQIEADPAALLAQVRKPSIWIAEKCAKTSSPPPSGSMKPNPFASLNHLTMPVAMLDSSSPSIDRDDSLQRQHGVSRRASRRRSRPRVNAGACEKARSQEAGAHGSCITGTRLEYLEHPCCHAECQLDRIISCLWKEPTRACAASRRCPKTAQGRSLSSARRPRRSRRRCTR